MNVLITGAAGNLGSHLARHILHSEPEIKLILMKYQRDVSQDISTHPRVIVQKADLSKPETLDDCLNDVGVIVHLAGVLFKARPEEFLHKTNAQYFENLITKAKEKKVKKVILISFPHVEGPTSRQSPARGRLDGNPISVHAQTRLEEEKYLFREIKRPISLRAGMVYGKGILMVDTAKWFAKRRLLGVWKELTHIHLISKTDFCRAVSAAIKNEKANGIYHIGDEGDDTLQSFLDFACDIWGYKRPWRMPLWLIYAVAKIFETFSLIFGTRSPLTKDFIDIGRVSYYGDTARFRKELLLRLTFKNVYEGIEEMKN